MSNVHVGSSFDAFLEEDGLLDEVDAAAVKRVVAWKIQAAMEAQHIGKKALAASLGTSRSQVDRLLDPENTAVQLLTITRAARAVGLRVRIELEPDPV